jgi:DNA-binding transcriptional LysR family regulator
MRLEALPVCGEERVPATGAAHPSVATARDLSTRTVLAFDSGCPHRKWLERRFARARVWPGSCCRGLSCQSVLGCAVVGMGVALMPRSVLDVYPERARLGVHALKGRFRSVRALACPAQGCPHAKVALLAEVPAPRPRKATVPARPAHGAHRSTGSAARR